MPSLQFPLVLRSTCKLKGAVKRRYRQRLSRINLPTRGREAWALHDHLPARRARGRRPKTRPPTATATKRATVEAHSDIDFFWGWGGWGGGGGGGGRGGGGVGGGNPVFGEGGGKGGGTVDCLKASKIRPPRPGRTAERHAVLETMVMAHEQRAHHRLAPKDSRAQPPRRCRP